MRTVTKFTISNQTNPNHKKETETVMDLITVIFLIELLCAKELFHNQDLIKASKCYNNNLYCFTMSL